MFLINSIIDGGSIESICIIQVGIDVLLGLDLIIGLFLEVLDVLHSLVVESLPLLLGDLVQFFTGLLSCTQDGFAISLSLGEQSFSFDFGLV
jgi:hypothetical protein